MLYPLKENLFVPFARPFHILFLTSCFICFIGFNPALAKKSESIKVAQNGKNIASLNKKIVAYKQRISRLEKQLAEKKQTLEFNKVTSISTLKTSENELKKQNLRVTKLERDAEVLTEQIKKINTENESLVKKFEELNILQQSLEKTSHNKALGSNESKITLIKLDLDKVNSSLKSSRIDADRAKRVYESQKRLLSLYGQENNPELLKLEQSLKNISQQLVKAERAKSAELRRLNKIKSAKTAKKSRSVAVVSKQTHKKQFEVNSNPKEKAWVYIVSGEQVKDLGRHLAIKEWLSAFDVTYMETSWGQGISGTDKEIEVGFIRQFRNDLGRIPTSSKLILIGHGLGGGAVIKAATEVAYAEGRIVDLLVALDPVGENKLKANIVFQPSSACSLPGDDQAKLNYFICMNEAKYRKITPNIKHFYNRWQKNAGLASDKHRQYRISDGEGNLLVLPTATGKFYIESKRTLADQKRVTSSGALKNGRLLIDKANQDIPNLLVQYLQ